MKKGFRIFVLLLIASLVLTGCGISNKDNNEKKVEKGTNTSKSGTLQRASLDEKVIVDRDGVKVTVKGLKYEDSWGPSIGVYVENNTSKNIMVQTRRFSINGFMIDPIFSEDVAAGKKANGDISIAIEDLRVANIKAIKDLEFDIIVVDGDSWDDIFTESGIKLQTNVKNYEQSYETRGSLVLDQSGVKIYLLKLNDKDSSLGADIYVYVENNTGQDITIQAKDVSINGFMIDPSFYSDVSAGKKSYETMTFFEDDLKDNDIKDIKEIELKFLVLNTSTYDTILETEVKKINVK